MSNQHRSNLNESGNIPESWDIVHTDLLSENIGGLYMQSECSDLTLVVENIPFHVHKVILASRSDYFRALLYGGLRESQNNLREIELKDTNAEGFKHLLKYIYTGRISLNGLKEETILEVLTLSNQYHFLRLQSSISEHLKNILTTSNVCCIFDTALMFSLDNLVATCCSFMDRNASDILVSDGFLNLSEASLEVLLLRDSFCAPEVNIFQAVQSWALHNNFVATFNNNISNTTTNNNNNSDSTDESIVAKDNKNISVEQINIEPIDSFSSLIAINNGNNNIDNNINSNNSSNNNNNHNNKSSIVQLIRLSLMSMDELLNVVRPSKFISADDILDAIKTQHSCKNTDLPFRGFMFPMENMASVRHQARVIEGDMKTALLDNNNVNYNLDQGFTAHQIEDGASLQKKGITIELGFPCIINNIVMLLWDRDTRSYSYYIETSMDSKEWVTVVDRRKYLCRSKQQLRFKQQVAKYIRVVGTHNTVNRVFHLVSFECYYNPHPCTLVDGLIVPSTNVATIDNAAWVTEGVSRSRNALINGNMVDYDWDSGYTCHQLGSGAIVVQLAQPFIVSSMRLLLWDCDQRSYSYYIEVSNDQQNWTRVVDKTMVPCRSWQYVFFDEQIVTFVKIVGTQNTANEVFHCVHFECPIEENALFDYRLQQLQQLASATLGSAASAACVTMVTTDTQQSASTSRLQGLSLDDNNTVDHGDGYGVGFLGGGGAMPGNN